MIRPLLLALALTAPAWAAPPPVGSEDWEVMAPWSDWIRDLQHEGVI